MNKHFLDFMGHLTDNCCPWSTSIIKITQTYIDVVFATSGSVQPVDLGWVNTHAVGSKWFITAEDGKVRVVVRFYDDDDRL